MSRPVSMILIDKSGTIAAGGTAQVVAAARPGRAYLFIQNVSDSDMWVNFGATAVAAQPSIKLVAGASFVMEAGIVCDQAISVICATTGKAFTAKEA